MGHDGKPGPGPEIRTNPLLLRRHGRTWRDFYIRHLLKRHGRTYRDCNETLLERHGRLVRRSPAASTSSANTSRFELSEHVGVWISEAGARIRDDGAASSGPPARRAWPAEPGGENHLSETRAAEVASENEER